MGVYEVGRYSFLRTELELLSEALAERMGHDLDFPPSPT